MLPLILILSSVAVRLTGIAYQSLWTDEIAAVMVSERSLLEVLLTITVQDVSPPLYYLLLHFWCMISKTEFFLRLFSIMFSGGTIYLTYLIGKRLFNRQVALFAALFLTFCPLSVYLAQEVRYYSLLEFLSVATLLGYLNVLDGKRSFWLFVPMLLGLYTHYYFLFIVCILFIWFLNDFLSRKIKPGSFLKSFVGALVLWAPWLFATSIQYSRKTYQFRPDLDISHAFLDIVSFLTLGHADGLNPWTGQPLSLSFLPAVLPFGVLFLGFLFYSIRKQAGGRIWVWLLLPTVAVLAISPFINVYGHRYFIILLPALSIALARGVMAINRYHVGYFIALMILAFQAISLNHYFSDERFWREDWRGLSEYLETHERTDDAIIVYNESQAGPLNYYYNGSLNQEPLLVGDILTFHQESETDIQKRIDLYFKKFSRIFFLPHYNWMYDPAGFALERINEKCIEDHHPDFQTDFRLNMRICFTSKTNAFKALWRTFDTYIDFSKHNFHASQLEGHISHLNDPWIWMGKWARFYVRRPLNGTKIKINTMIDLKYHDNQISPFYVLVDGKPVKMFSMQHSGEHQFITEMPKIKGELVEIGLYSTKTFNPQKFFGGNDASPKSFMVGYVGVE